MPLLIWKTVGTAGKNSQRVCTWNRPVFCLSPVPTLLIWLTDLLQPDSTRGARATAHSQAWRSQGLRTYQPQGCFSLNEPQTANGFGSANPTTAGVFDGCHSLVVLSRPVRNNSHSKSWPRNGCSFLFCLLLPLPFSVLIFFLRYS